MWLVLGCLPVVTAVLWYRTRSALEDRVRASFERQVQATTIELRSRVATYELVLRAMAAFVERPGSIDRAGWARFVDGLHLSTHDPGILAIEWIERVAPQEVPTHLARRRGEGPDDYDIHPPSVDPQADRFPVVYVEPLDPNRGALGFDIASEERRRVALERARDSGRPAATGHLALVQDGAETGPAFLMLFPVYRRLPAEPTVAARREALLGFTAGAFRVADILGGLPKPRTGIRISLSDEATVAEASPADPLQPELVLPFAIAGHPWQLEFRAGPELADRYDPWEPGRMLLFGVLVGALVLRLIWMQRRSEHRARALATEMAARATEGEARLRAIVDSEPECVKTVSLDGRLIEMNPAGLAMVEADSITQVAGRPVLDLVHPEDRDRYQVFHDRAAAGETVWLAFRVVGLRGGLHWMESTSVPLRHEGRIVSVLSVTRDVTKARHMETQLRQAQKMEALGTLAGGIAHDFNNILTSIIGFSELAWHDANGDARLRERLANVLEAGRRAQGLVQQMTAFSRRQDIERVPLDPLPVVRDALTLVRAGLPASIAIRTELADDAPVIRADATQLHQIVMNLSTNAAQAMRRGGGLLEIILARVTSATHPFLPTTGPYLQLLVRDSGQGMEAETVERIFDPFFTTKPPSEGTGLGLSVVHGIVQLHEGMINVQSTPGRGTTIEIFIPACDATPMTEFPDSPVPRGHGEHILFVDDEAPLAELGRRQLEGLGYRVTALTDPREALAVFRAGPSRFDLVVTDLTMPHLGGIELAAELLHIHPGTAILLNTGYGGHLTPDGVRQLGLRGLVPKPHTSTALGRAVHDALTAA